MYLKEGYISLGKMHFLLSQSDRYKCILMYLDVSERYTSRYMQDTHQDTCKIHMRCMCMIHKIHILITNTPKFDNKRTVTLGTGGRVGFAGGNLFWLF